MHLFQEDTIRSTVDPMRLVALVAAIALLAPAADRYDERFRPQFHFSPDRNWTNDPCGLIYVSGTYHFFFQFNPLGDVWGHMSWGHATSRDLVHWEQQPVAIPEGDGVMIFTGSSVLDGKADLIHVDRTYPSGERQARQADSEPRVQR